MTLKLTRRYAGGFAFALCAAALASLALLGCGGGRDPVTVRLIAMNDFHGNFAPPSTSNGGSMILPNGGAGQKVTVGGAAYLATLVKNLQAANTNNIVVGAGDGISASPFESMITHDEATVDILN